MLNSNVNNNPSLINPLFHNHGIASTTEQFNVHNTNPREISEYEDNSDEEQEDSNERVPLEPVQSTNKGKVCYTFIFTFFRYDNNVKWISFLQFTKIKKKLLKVLNYKIKVNRNSSETSNICNVYLCKK